MEILIKDWLIKQKIIGNTCYYYAVGHIFGSKKFLDGTLISTSIITKRNDRKIKTKSGTTYILSGDPLPQFYDFLIENQITISEKKEKLYNNKDPLYFLKIND